MTDLTTLGAAAAPRDAESAALLAAELDLLEMLPYEDPTGSLGPADDAERRALQLGRSDLRQRARLVRADAEGRRGEVASAGRTSQEVNRWAAEHGDTHLLARSHRLVSAFFDRIGDFSSALEHALRAVEHCGGRTHERTRADHVLALAVALGRAASHDAARQQFAVAEEMAAALQDVPLGLAVLNNLAYLEYMAGDPARALASAERLLAFAAANAVPLDMTYRDTVARAQMGVGRYADAEKTLLPGLAEPLGVDADMLVEGLVTLAETQRLQGHLDSAWANLERCTQLCETNGLHYVRVQVLQERAELLAAGGRYREAYEQLQEFHAEHQAQFSAESDARARALQAVFETEEARRDSERFRELSLRDPLTGLYNRRYVEDQTPVLLRAAANQGSPLSLALVDVDHFKQVNDTLSHEIGDTLLRLLAGLLAGAVDGHGFAARLGGDEFLLVLPGVVTGDAVLLCERLQRRIGSDIDIGVPVTTSIGVTSVGPGRVDLPAVLGDVDRRLYAAKRAGRDRVVA